MPQALTVAVENNFTKGLVTEATALNFPENAATDCDNCTFSLIGNVFRRLGIDYEVNSETLSIARSGLAINSYKWDNAGGDGNTQIVCVQVGSHIRFWKSSAATTTDPLSTQLLVSDIFLGTYVPSGGTFDVGLEAQFSSGNGYLFITHPNCDPIYCTYQSDTVLDYPITVKIRDFTGVVDALGINQRPASLSNAHAYNLSNQGWTTSPGWTATSTSLPPFASSMTFTVAAGIAGISGGQIVSASFYSNITNAVAYTLAGTVTSYAGTTLVLNITSTLPASGGLIYSSGTWTINPINTGYISTWFASQGNYPSNADVWWRFKNASNVFDPATTQPNVSFSLGEAPKGHYILNAFNQNRFAVSGASGVTDVTTLARPTISAWFQGRVWYTGINASQAASGTARFTTWTENLYFSQVVNKTDDFGNCYQVNDPTSEELFGLLPTDGGVIVIQGSGAIYKLFPIQNGMLVFAANGVWFVTGSQGIGFTANDYTVTKISSVRSFSSSSYVDVEGLPYFWNDSGIYTVQPTQNGSLAVQTVSYNTIDTFYNEIPLSSRKLARGAYDPINYTIQWIYKSEEVPSITEKYSFDRILNYNTANKAFFPYSVEIPIGDGYEISINGINYVSYPGGTDTPAPSFKYLSSNLITTTLTFADEHDDTYVDWDIVGGVSYDSYFVTGYKVRGQAIKKYQPQYLQIWSNVSDTDTGYKIQGIWDYSTSGNSGRWTTIQNINLPNTSYFSTVYRRHKIRGHGYSLQFKVLSQDNKAFDIAGWAVTDLVNQGT